MEQATPYDPAELECSLVDRFEKMVRLYPENLAAKDDQVELTYGALNRSVNQLARLIGTRDHGEIVALLLDLGAAQAVAILGIWKAGRAYLPLDPNLPPERLAFMLADTRCGLIVTNNQNLPLASSLAKDRCEITNLDEIPADTPDSDLRLKISPEAMAAVLYTSGSTGEPKGVIQNHRNILHSIQVHSRHLSIRPDDRFSRCGSIAFVGTLFPFLGALLNGAAILTFDLKRKSFAELTEWLAAEKITIFGSVTTMFRNFAASIPPGKTFPQLRWIVMGGETIYQQDVEQFKKLQTSQGCRLVNTLGSTEMMMLTDFVFDKETEMAEEVLPAGFPVDDKAIMLLDEEGRPVGPGEIGELVVRSKYLSPGYWERPDLTAASFKTAQDGSVDRLYFSGDLGRFRPDGSLIHLGRKDGMVKIRGHRVEIGEIESRLLKLSMIGQAAVLARKDGRGHVYLVAYIVPKGGEATPEIIRKALVIDLPGYMMPSRFVILDAMPLNNNGKIDRQALPDPDCRHRSLDADPVPPRNQLEAHLARIFETVLCLRPVGVRDDFFELGGDSLSFMWMFAELEKEFGAAPSMEALLVAPTVECIAGLLGRNLDSAPADHQHGRTNRKGMSGKVIGSILLPYARGIRLLSWLSGHSLLQRTLLMHWSSLIRQYLSCSGEHRMDEAYLIRWSLATNLWLGWKGIALSRCGPEDFTCWVKISGLEHMRAVQEKGGGVILITSHHPLGHIIPLALQRAGFSDYMMIAMPKAGRLLRSMGLGDIANNSLLSLVHRAQPLYASQLVRSRQVLARGGVVSIAADGYQGTSQGLMLPFLGRSRNFKTSFAELALSTGATVVPVFASSDPHGHIQVRFLAPLTVTGSDHEEQVESLVRQYVEVLSRQWREDFGNVSLRHVHRYLRLPKIDEVGEEAPPGAAGAQYGG